MRGSSRLRFRDDLRSIYLPNIYSRGRGEHLGSPWNSRCLELPCRGIAVKLMLRLIDGKWLWRCEQVDMLLMQNSVRKLFFKAVIIQELLDPPGNDCLFQYIIDVGPSMHVHSQQLRDQGLEVSAKMRR